MKEAEIRYKPYTNTTNKGPQGGTKMHIYELIKTLILTYGLDLLFIAALAAGIYYLIKNGKKDIAYSCIYDLVIRAENALGEGTGELKYTYVVSEIYTKLPMSIRFFFTKKDIDTYIELAVEKMKAYLETELENCQLL